MTTVSTTSVDVKGKVMDTYVAYRMEGNVRLYIEDIDLGQFTENRVHAQVFEGPGWKDQVASLGASLERIIV